jgi:hypothetical protein
MEFSDEMGFASMNKFPGLIFALIVFLTICTSCTARPGGQVTWPLHLANFSQNYVSVELSLEQDGSQKTFLVATFTPENGYHLYSKNIPRDGIYGQGRPTLLELTLKSEMIPVGDLIASAIEEVSNMGPDTLLVYPAGPVTLKLQVNLPAGTGLHDDVVSVTYEACSQTACRTPVIGKVLNVRVPGRQDAQP